MSGQLPSSCLAYYIIRDLYVTSSYCRFWFIYSQNADGSEFNVLQNLALSPEQAMENALQYEIQRLMSENMVSISVAKCVRTRILTDSIHSVTRLTFT